MAKSLPYAGVGLLFVAFLVVSITSHKSPDEIDASLESSSNDASPQGANRQKQLDAEKEKKLALGKEVAKNMATGEIILMASCLGKRGSIPRDKMGDYIAAAVAKQGITRRELFDNWDKYMGFAREAEKRNMTTCLE